MKLLHTSDWHLAHQWMGQSRLEEHRHFLRWLCDELNQRKPDALLVSGDIFDHGMPSHESQKLYYESLMALKDSNCPNIILTAGNHDSVSFLEASRGLCEALGLRVFSHLHEDLEQHLCEIFSSEGELRGYIYAIPYLRERELRVLGQNEAMEERKNSLLQGIRGIYHAEFETQNLPKVAMGHFFAVGSSLSDSERELYLGELEAVPLEALSKTWDYLALGHLHRSQSVGEEKRAWYSGTPIPLSFNEAKREQVLLEVEVRLGETPQVERVRIPRFREIRSLKIEPDDIKTTLSNMECSSELQTWIEITLKEARPWDWVSSCIEKSLKGKNAQVLAVKFEEKQTKSQNNQEVLESLEMLNPESLFKTYLSDSEIEEKEHDQLLKKFKVICDELSEQGGQL